MLKNKLERQHGHECPDTTAAETTLEAGTTLQVLTLPFAVLLSAARFGPIPDADQKDPNLSEMLLSLPIHLKYITPPPSL